MMSIYHVTLIIVYITDEFKVHYHIYLKFCMKLLDLRN
jgi:hypothetical protein